MPYLQEMKYETNAYPYYFPPAFHASYEVNARAYMVCVQEVWGVHKRRAWFLIPATYHEQGMSEDGAGLGP